MQSWEYEMNKLLNSTFLIFIVKALEGDLSELIRSLLNFITYFLDTWEERGKSNIKLCWVRFFFLFYQLKSFIDDMKWIKTKHKFHHAQALRKQQRETEDYFSL